MVEQSIFSKNGKTALGKISKKLEKTTYEVPYFSDPKIDYVYKTNISVYGNELSGIFITKKI